MKRLLTITLFLSALGSFATAAKKPNLVFIMADDLNFDSLGCYGAPIKDITPHLDALAGQGIRFERAYPFEAGIAPFLKPGKNEIEVRVSNVWHNRFIGDSSLPRDQWSLNRSRTCSPGFALACRPSRPSPRRSNSAPPV
jgi:hypothetical protein